MPEAGRAPPLPSPVPEWVVPAAFERIDLLSDLHLSAQTPRTLDALASHLRHGRADALLILGDLFEVWVGDDQRSRPFERGCTALLREASRSRRLAFMPGNRDFLLGARMADEAGLERLADPTVLVAWGRRWLLSHGDALCLDDTAYQRWRRETRSPQWQADVLARPLSERLRLAAAVRGDGDRRRAAEPFDPDRWADVDRAAALDWLDATGCEALIHGHTHRPGTYPLDARRVRHVLSDWDLDSTPPRADVLRLSAAGLARHAPDTAATAD
jgi:UDP-2,3-diacylglucosamine hydrolase